MKKLISGLILMFFVVTAGQVFAQAQQVKIMGVFTQKCNAEVILVNSNDKLPRLASVSISGNNDKFSFAVPFNAAANYQLRVTTMKGEGKHAKPENTALYPLKLAANQTVSVSINPILINQEKQTGLTIAKQPIKFATATILGSLVNWKLGGELQLSKVVEGNLKTVQSFNIAKDSLGVFSFLIPIEKEGVYYLSNLRWSSRIYLKPNDQLQFNIDGKSGIKNNWLKSTAENKLLAQWEQLLKPVTLLSQVAKPQETAFTAEYQTLQPKIAPLLNGAKSGNAKFDVLFPTAVKLDNSLTALNTLLKLSTKQTSGWVVQAKEFANVSAFYKEFILKNRVNTANLMQLGEGEEYLRKNAKFSLVNLTDEQKMQLSDADKLKLMMNSISNDTLKAYVLKTQLSAINISNYTEFKEVFLPYQKYAKLESVKAEYNSIKNFLSADSVFIGKSSYDFTLPDVNGKMVSMKDFKGKVIVIDLWATWCGPCKAQIPFLQKIEEEYKGNNNVVFVAISQDRASDKQKWLNMINEKHMEGIQLLDDMGKSMGRKYKVNAIPRYMLIDKKGNWIEVRCPLPEDAAKFKKYIEKALKTNI